MMEIAIAVLLIINLALSVSSAARQRRINADLKQTKASWAESNEAWKLSHSEWAETNRFLKNVLDLMSDMTVSLRKGPRR